MILHWNTVKKKRNMNHSFVKIAVTFEVITLGMAHRNYLLRLIHSDMNKNGVYYRYQFQEKVSSGVDGSGI